MDNAIEQLINRAELCLERGQHKMVAGYLEEVEQRSAESEMSDELWERYVRLTENAEPTLDEAQFDAPAGNKCNKCKGTGKFKKADDSQGTCFDCQGKGYQTEKDVERVQNYWAYRQREANVRKAAARDWPF